MKFTALFLTIFLFLAQYIYAQLTSESVAVRPCSKRNPYPYTDTAFAYDPNIVWYINYGSPHLFRSFAEAFLGYSPRNQQELDALNLRITLRGNSVSYGGYGSGFIQQACNLGTIYQSNCTTITSTNNNPFLEAMNPSVDTLIWTDNANTLVISRCSGSGPYESEGWKILSITPTIDQNLLSAILHNLTMSGYDTSNYQ